ncbi:hypothetical protein HMPREF1092_02990 [Clostridium thermobutyricum]|uniref:Uncharacterized protein n=1 Tax=Clostridium thermobutyricum TaxID=29372 RepID=N9WAD6_9CLOT|nr:hypothetical protein [Clostridium thermobutyricum]ENY99854.1 hypothetical protein HMPREF1092_02990 [Clostridium thermobutyricum]
MKGKLGYLISGICAVGVITYGIYLAVTFNNKENEESKETSLYEDNINLESNSENNLKFYNSLSKDEKIKIARELFDDYINENRTDWSIVKSQNLKREPVICLTDYRINDIDIESQDIHNFTVSVSYDIQYTNESDMWVAGNGELKDNNWVVDKFAVVDITQINDKYVITNIGTG